MTINSVYFSNLLHCFFALTEVSQAVRIPVLIGSGVTYDNLERYVDDHRFSFQGGWPLGQCSRPTASEEVHDKEMGPSKMMMIL